MLKSLIILLTCLLHSTLYAHIGSSEVVMQGNAGPYKLLVSVKPPDVIPGIARVNVYMQAGNVGTVSLRAVYYRTGDEGSPAADEMQPVAGHPGQFTGETWFMNGGSSSVQITVKGSLGAGELIVPVVAIATTQKKLPPSTGYLLAAMGIFLLILLLTMVGVGASGAVTKAAQPIPAVRKKTALAAVVIAALLLSAGIYGGKYWIQSFVDTYARYMFHPTQAVSSVINVNGAAGLSLLLDTSIDAQRRELYSYIVPDHGKMMHVFVVRLPAMDAFAHLHPVRVDEASYRTILPNLPKGKYLLFADIVYVSGFTETIKDTFDIAISITGSAKQPDHDDAFAFAIPNDLIDNPQTVDPANTIICGKPGGGVKLKDGSTMVWQGMSNEPLEVGKLYNLQFAVLTPDKTPAILEPYMGMIGHAAIIRSDGNVYMHLHPMGTASMAAETNFANRLAQPQGEYNYPDPQNFRDDIDNYMQYLSGLSDSAKEAILMQNMSMPGMKSTPMDSMTHANMVEFPYSFPSPGQYRIWVQVKRNGQVLTAAFDKVVK